MGKDNEFEDSEFEYSDILKFTLLNVLEPPWKHTESEELYGVHWLIWFYGWAWALVILAVGALVAPSFVQLVGLWGTSYQDALIIGVAVLWAFLVQVLFTLGHILFFFSLKHNWPLVVALPLGAVVGLLPIASVGYGIYYFLTWAGAGQRSITIAFVGGLFVKTFVIPAIVGAVKSKAFKVFMRWLRGGKAKSA